MFLWVKVVYYDMKSQMQSKAINKGKAIPTRYNNLDFSFLYKPGYKSKYTFLHSLFHTRREGILDCKSYAYPKFNNHFFLSIRAKKFVTSIKFLLPSSNLVVSFFFNRRCNLVYYHWRWRYISLLSIISYLIP